MQFDGYDYLIGADEVGRGCLAGPLVAAALAVKVENLKQLEGISDSKKLTPDQRLKYLKRLFPYIDAFSVVSLSSRFIDKYGIKKANIFALEKAVGNLASKFLGGSRTLALVDHYKINLAYPGMDIVSSSHADRDFEIVALASIFAKVLRDFCLVCLEEEFPEFSFANHKGYGTENHLRELKLIGPVSIHRQSFKPLCQPVLFDNF
jgi:ribonuclease HII